MGEKLAGSTVLVTGATSGIGAATARRFLDEGARVIGTGRSEAPEDLSGLLFERCDHADVDDVKRLFERVAAYAQSLDVLFVNAGTAKFAPFSSVTPQQFDEQFDVNVKGAFFTIQAALPLLRSGSSVVLNTSIQQDIGTPMASVYAASKAALGSLARTLATELAEQGIRVNAVSPGGTNTAIYQKMGLPPEVIQGLAVEAIGRTPAKRFAEPNEIANAVLFLAGSEAQYIYGVNLRVDGGFGLKI